MGSRAVARYFNKSPMTPKQYRAERRKRGSQTEVAKLLGVDPQTISRRERGELPINKEAEMALRALKVKGKS
jgi:transcriptional regulator with XRE-family HTH domain